jgi:hypothetical protein
MQGTWRSIASRTQRMISGLISIRFRRARRAFSKSPSRSVLRPAASNRFKANFNVASMLSLMSASSNCFAPGKRYPPHRPKNKEGALRESSSPSLGRAILWTDLARGAAVAPHRDQRHHG